jgi:signal transduction histidine kinase
MFKGRGWASKITKLFSTLLFLSLFTFSYFHLSALEKSRLQATWETRRALIYNNLKGLSASILSNNGLMRDENLRPLFRDPALQMAVLKSPDQKITGGYRLLSRREDDTLLLPLTHSDQDQIRFGSPERSNEDYFGETDEWDLFEFQTQDSIFDVFVPLLGPKINNQRIQLATLELRYDLSHLQNDIFLTQLRFMGFLLGLAACIVFVVFRLLRSVEENLELRLSNEALRANKQLMQAFAHDVRKPFHLFRALQSGLEHVTSVAQLRELLSAFTQEVDTGLRSVQGMIEDTLELASGRALDRQWVPLREVLVEALESSVARHPRFGNRIHWELEFDGSIAMDRGRMLRVFWNLFENAFQAMNAESRIYIRTTQREGVLRVSIRNTGSLIEKEDLEKIFQPSFTKNRPTGTGLGLTIVRDLVNRHGGQVWCESRPDLGVEFHVEIPMTEKYEKVS